MQITVKVNGADRSADVEPRMLLAHLIREEFGLTGTHVGCDTTSCGACTVLLDGRPIKSCTMFGVQADGREVTTVEGLLQDGLVAGADDGRDEGGPTGNDTHDGHVVTGVIPSQADP